MQLSKCGTLATAVTASGYCKLWHARELVQKLQNRAGQPSVVLFHCVCVLRTALATMQLPWRWLRSCGASLLTSWCLTTPQPASWLQSRSMAVGGMAAAAAAVD